MIDARLSNDIEVGAKRTPTYSTDVITMDSGHEVRNENWVYPLFRYTFELAPGFTTDQELNDTINLFHAAGGMADTFRWLDRFDYQGVGEAVGIGTGAPALFQLFKSHTRGASTRYRKVTLPVSGTAVIYVDGVVQPSGWTLDYATGVLTITAALGGVITADFEFDVPVRFEDDMLELIGHMSELEQPTSISLIEVKSEDIV